MNRKIIGLLLLLAMQVHGARGSSCYDRLNLSSEDDSGGYFPADCPCGHEQTSGDEADDEWPGLERPAALIIVGKVSGRHFTFVPVPSKEQEPTCAEKACALLKQAAKYFSVNRSPMIPSEEDLRHVYNKKKN